MSIVEKRYAEALLKVSPDRKWLDRSLSDLKIVTYTYTDNSDLKKFLINPEIKTEAKKKAVIKIFDNGLHPHLLNFILLLIDKGRISLLPDILNEYVYLSNKQKNILDIKIISVKVLKSEQIEQIENKYKKLYNANSVRSTIEINQDIIGGIIIEVGDKVFDGSIRSQLLNLKKHLQIS